MYDYYESTIWQKFKKFFAKLQMFKDIDIKMLGTVVVVIIGVVLGLMVLMG